MATALNPQNLISNCCASLLTTPSASPSKSSSILLHRRPFLNRRRLRTTTISVTAPVAAAAMGGAQSASGVASVVDASAVDALRDITVYSAVTGEPVLFRDLWDQDEGVAVVALLRHFGCICCWEFASVLKESISRFEAAGVKLIAVGVGSPENARMLAERLPFPLEYLYADPGRKAYDVLGLYYGLGRTFFNPASVKVFSRLDSLKKVSKNYTIAATPDDKSSVLQQGGMLLFKGKELLYARKDEGTGDHTPLDEVFNICCKVPVA